MRKPVTVGAATLATFLLGAMLAVFVAGSAVAASTTPKKTATTTLATGADTTTTTASPTDSFFVVNGTVNAASDHEIVGSSAFPNYANGAVDNYYSLARAHVDNSPFAEGLASPFDTGPIGQTAAAGNTQQPQYADARWPGSSGKAEYGNKGGPYAVATADDSKATADASAASNELTGPSAPKGVVIPKALNGRLRAALAGWKAKWQGRLAPKKSPPTVTPPKPTVPVPSVPKPTVTTPIGTVTAPAVGGVNAPTPTPVQVPTPTVPSPTASAPSRSLAAQSTPTDGETALASSAQVSFVQVPAKPKKTTTTKKTTTPGTPKTEPLKSYALVSSGESRLGRVSLGGGQIVIEGIHVTASITNDGSPTYKANVSIASASIGGIPVTIDQDGVHVAGQGQALPYQQASDALNNALKQAGIQLFLVAPEVTTCGQAGGSGGSSTDTTTTTSTSTSTSTDQSSGNGTSDACGGGPSTCDQAGSSGGGPGVPTTPGASTTSTDTTTTPDASCGDSSTCDQMGTGTSTGTSTTTTSTAPTSTTKQTGTTQTTTSTTSCDSAGMGSTAGTCGPATGGSSSATAPMGAASAPSPTDPSSFGAGGIEQTVTATGVHVVFTQPVDQAGVPAQHIEHILGEVSVDSLAVPAGPDAGLDLSAAGGSGALSSCLGGAKTGGKTAAGGGLSAGGGSSAGGAAAAGGSLSSSSSGYDAGSQPVSGTGATGNSLPVAFATALRKPLWLLLAYLVWQGLVVGTGWSLWNWRKGDAS